MANAPNPSGNNQFQGFSLEPPYGAVSKADELLRSAPISGAPISGRAIGTPERQRSARRRGAAGKGRGQAPQPTTTVVPQLPLNYDKQQAMIWQQLAAIPGASDLVKDIASRAADQASGKQA